MEKVLPMTAAEVPVSSLAVSDVEVEAFDINGVP